MKIKTAYWKEDPTVISTFSVAVWEAARWVLSGSSVGEEIRRRAYASVGTTITDPMVMDYIKFMYGAETNLFEVKLRRAFWVPLDEN